MMAQTRGTTRRGAAASSLRRGASCSPTKGPRKREFYGGWSEEIVERLENELRGRRGLSALELGSELEIALCQTLQVFLPERAGVCRGMVVDVAGHEQGDDIIVYDAARFPTLRGLGGSIALRERVPAEAVLAYIEVKRTLYAREKVPKKNTGQSLMKACRQIAAVKGLQRDPMSLEMIAPRIALPDNAFARRPGFPEIRNPWYAAVWALNLRVDRELRHDPAGAMKQQIADIRKSGIPYERLPDVIAAGSVMMLPVLPGADAVQPRPFITPETELLFTNGMKALGAALEHLIWAIDDILLGEIPWRQMLAHQIETAQDEAGSVRLGLGRPASATARSGRAPRR
jgi:hypothetical protein